MEKNDDDPFTRSIVVKNDAELSDLSQNDITQLSLTYTSDYSATTTISIHITKLDTQFEKSFYELSYDQETGEIVMDSIISITSDEDALKLSVSIDPGKCLQILI